jgi:hypothetical protein
VLNGQVMTRIPLKPEHPDRICWGCDKYCPADDLACGNGTIRTLHPAELFGDDWNEWVTQKKMEGRRHSTGSSLSFGR